MLFARRNILVGVCTAVLAFAVVNWIDFRRAPTCIDCDLVFGQPFAFYRDGGFSGDHRIIWAGVAGDVGAVVATGLLGTWIIGVVRRRIASPR